MPDLFISYARPDEAKAKGIEERLKEAGWTVWRDSRLESGEDYRSQIQEALDEARMTIVLWSKAACESAWVRSEASRAANHKRLMAARLEDVAPPLGLDQFQATNLTSFRPGEPHEGVDTLLEQLDRRLKRTESQIEDLDASAMRRLRKRIREVKTSTLAVLALAPLLALTYGSGLLDGVFKIDTRTQLLALQARSLSAPRTLDERIVPIVIDHKTVEIENERQQERRGPELGRFGANWRGLQAQALRRLTRAGAKVVAFDVAFPYKASQSELVATGNQELANAIYDARKAATSVVVVATSESERDRVPELDPSIQSALFEHLKEGGLGFLASPCLGFHGDLPFANLLTRRKDPDKPQWTDPQEQKQSPGWPGLALASVAGLWGVLPSHLDTEKERLHLRDRQVRLAALGPPLTEDSQCGVLRKGDRTAELLLELEPSGLERGDPRVVMFEDVTGKADLSSVRDKIALVGAQLPGGDEHSLFWCRGAPDWSCGMQNAWGMNLQAWAISTLLQDAPTVQAVGPFSQFGLMLLLCLGVAWLRLSQGQRSAWVRRGWLMGAIGVSVAITLVAAVGFRLAMDGAYHIVAMAVTYSAVGRLDKRA